MLAWPASVVRVVPWEEQNGQAGARSAAAKRSAMASTAKVARRRIRVIRGLRGQVSGGECVRGIMRPGAGTGQAASARLTPNGPEAVGTTNTGAGGRAGRAGAGMRPG